ncbi:CYFA0S01e12915g1_1 [Cyberlindnera fabianii]|uniref:CYFA0S01e12915g1_1 n=1 Tax=Cyberlindnera fabianii TaxID=36022 RepID=A0A061AJ79_CYBFA|nr:CYFA0S01e12915g1_1 [Cyberlindnera fabianii]
MRNRCHLASPAGNKPSRKATSMHSHALAGIQGVIFTRCTACLSLRHTVPHAGSCAYREISCLHCSSVQQFMRTDIADLPLARSSQGRLFEWIDGPMKRKLQLDVFVTEYSLVASSLVRCLCGEENPSKRFRVRVVMSTHIKLSRGWPSQGSLRGHLWNHSCGQLKRPIRVNWPFHAVKRSHCGNSAAGLYP